MKTRLVAVLTIALGLAIGAFALLNLRDAGLAPMSTGTALVGGPFSLTDQTGARVTDETFRGKYMLVFFGYTSCPDVCPATLQVITSAMQQIGTKAGEVTPLFITVDPGRDTPAVMADYLTHFDPRIVGLTGSAAEIATAERAYRVYAAKPDPQHDDVLDHSSIIYLMDREGKFLKHFTYTTDVQGFAKALGDALAGG